MVSNRPLVCPRLFESAETTASYEYGANGLRKSKTVNGTTTGFVWNEGSLAAELEGSNITNVYNYGADGIESKTTGTAAALYLKDSNGNITGATDTNGNVSDSSYRYDAFGNVLSTDTPDPFGYCGEYLDIETGLIYLRNRYYDSSTGRFITEDPAKDGVNWYSYCAGNPIMLVDRWGLYAGSLIDEMIDGYDKYGLQITIKVANLSEEAKKLQYAYADEKGYYTITKEFWGPTYGYYNRKDYITCDNAVDAIRHMSWNSMMTRDVGLEQAAFFANNHEYYNLNSFGWIIKENDKVILTKMNQPTLMDLWNNQVGRQLANREELSDKNYRQLFEYAVENDMLILDANQAYEIYGVLEYVNADDWTVTVEWNKQKEELTFKKDGLPDIILKIGK